MKKTHFLGLAFVAAAMSFLAACQKNDAVTPSSSIQPLNQREGFAVVPPGNGTAVPFTHPNTKGTLALVSGVYQARNFHQGTVQNLTDTTQWAVKAGKYFYKLGTTNDGADSTDVNYDFKFQGSATGDFVANPSKYTLGYVDQAFSSVTASTSFTSVASGVLGYNRTGVAGWYNYNISTHIVSAVQNRTILLIEDGTPVYKIRINSIYKDGAPDTPTAATDYPYFSFDYQAL